MDDRANAAIEVFRKFSSEMKAWNDKYYPLMSENAVQHKDDAVAELTPIFDKYVWSDAVRRDERLNAPSTSQPSEYDTNTDTIVDTKFANKKVLIEVQAETGFRNKFRYTVTKNDETWKIKRKDVFRPLNDQWKSYHI